MFVEISDLQWLWRPSICLFRRGLGIDPGKVACTESARGNRSIRAVRAVGLRTTTLATTHISFLQRKQHSPHLVSDSERRNQPTYSLQDQHFQQSLIHKQTSSNSWKADRHSVGKWKSPHFTERPSLVLQQFTPSSPIFLRSCTSYYPPIHA
jgi:hypothetical protein